MNSFQSLLNSYSQLRKRTYEFGTISEGGFSNQSKFTAQCPARVTPITTQFKYQGEIENYKEDLKTAFNTPQPYIEGGYDGPAVWWSDETQTQFNFKIPGAESTGSLPKTDLACILLFLGESELATTDPNTRTEPGGVGPEGEELPPVPIDPESSRNHMELHRELQKLVDSGVIPYEEAISLYATFASMSWHPKGTPGYDMVSQFQNLLHALSESGVFNPEELREATLELQRDAISLLKFLNDSETQELLEAALKDPSICIPPTKELLRLRERFFFTKNKPNNKMILSYGNLRGESDTPSKMSNLGERLCNSKENQEDMEANWPASQTGKTKKGKGSSYSMYCSEDSAVSIGSAQEQKYDKPSDRKPTNGLHLIMDKYKDVKICTAEGEPEKSLFETSDAEGASQLSNRIAEKSSVLVDIARRISRLPDLGADGKPNPQKEKLKKNFDEGMQELANEAEKDCEQLKSLVRITNQAEAALTHGEPLPGTPMRLKNLTELVNETGTDMDICNGMGEDFRNTFLSMAHKELASPLHESLSNLDKAGEFEGSVEITDVYPDGRKVSQVTGRKEGRRSVADNIAVFSSRDDVLKLFEDLGINPNTPAAQEILNNPHTDSQGRNPRYIVPLSDKFYRESGWTSQGKMEKGGAYRDKELIARHVRNSYYNDKDIGSIQKSCEIEAEQYLDAKDHAAAQIVDPKLLDLPDGNNLDNAKVNEVEGNTLDEFLSTEFLHYTNDPMEFAKLELLKDDIEDWRKTHGKDPNSPASQGQLNSISHALADVKRRAARRDMSVPERRKSEMASDILNSMAGHGSQLAIIIAKAHDSTDTPLVTEDDIRCLDRIRALEIRSGISVHTEQINECINSKTRRTNSDSGAVQVALETKINAKKLSALKKEIGC